MLAYKLISLFGIFAFLFIAWIFSEDRKRADLRLCAWGIILQFAFAVAILKTSPGLFIFDLAKNAITKVLDFTDIGAAFLFGSLSKDFSIGAVFAFKVLPTIIFVSSLMGILYYLGIIQAVIKAIAWVMRRTMKTGGAETFMTAAFVFTGIETVTAIKNYIKRMTRSELFTLMTAFMATIAGSVMAAYASFGVNAGHLLAASVMSAPAALVISKLIVPSTGKTAEEEDDFNDCLSADDSNVIEAASNGAEAGLKLALAIGALLIAFISLIGMADALLGYAGTSFGGVTGYIFAPFALLMGVPLADAFTIGQLLGIKVIFNEFISYQKLQPLIQAGTLDPRSIVIATYALCSFANFGSLAILIGGIGGVAPERKKEVVSLGLKSILAGSLASFLTATIAGVII